MEGRPSEAWAGAGLGRLGTQPDEWWETALDGLGQLKVLKRGGGGREQPYNVRTATPRAQRAEPQNPPHTKGVRACDRLRVQSRDGGGPLEVHS